jgi:glycosyltransferase involved in cell wall biosynthesis
MGGIRGLRKYGRDVYRWNVSRALQRLLPDVDVVHAHFMHAGAASALEVSERFDVPVIVKETSSGLNNSFHRLKSVRHGRKLRETFLRRLRHVVVLNEDARKQYEALPFEHLTIHKIPNGIELEPGHPTWRLNPSRRLLFLGRLQAIKGVHLLLEAFALTIERLPGWTVRICGSGEEEARLRALSARLGLENKVEFRGVTDEPLRELADCSMLVMPSLAEGMSNTLLEAMAVGTPVVASEVGANSEMLADESGWLMPRSEDINAFAEVLVEAALDDHGKIQRSANARARVESWYGFETVARSVEAVYSQMLAARKVAG